MRSALTPLLPSSSFPHHHHPLAYGHRLYSPTARSPSMAALTFLKHWRPLTPAGNLTAFKPDLDTTSSSSDDASLPAADDEDDGPFFDLDFSSSYEDGDDDKFSIELEPNSKPQAFTVSLLRSAYKLRELATRRPKSPSERGSHKRTTLALRLKLEDMRPGSSGGGAEERRFSKEVVLRYLGKLRPLQVRASCRAAQKKEKEKEKEKEAVGESGRPRVVCRHLGKSRSASAAVAEAPARKRRDDSLLKEEVEEAEDGIKGAIAHCKRSFNASRDEILKPPLPRSRSDSCEERRSVDVPLCRADCL